MDILTEIVGLLFIGLVIYRLQGRNNTNAILGELQWMYTHNKKDFKCKVCEWKAFKDSIAFINIMATLMLTFMTGYLVDNNPYIEVGILLFFTEGIVFIVYKKIALKIYLAEHIEKDRNF